MDCIIVCYECEEENIDETDLCSNCRTMINPEIIKKSPEVTEKDEINYNRIIKIGWISLLFFLDFWIT